MKLLAIPFILCATCLFAQDAREVIGRYLDKVSNGDVDNWKKIKSIYTESEVYYSQQDFEQKVDLLRPDNSHFSKSYKIFPFNHKIELYEDSAFTNRLSTFYFLKKRTILLLANMPPIIKPPPSRDEDYLADHLPVVIRNVMQKNKSIELLGIKEFLTEDLQCYEIKISTENRTYVLYINTDTFLLEYYNGRKDGDLSFLTKFSNYKRVDEFLLPLSDYAMRNGVAYYWRNIRKIEINADIDPEIFKYDEK